MPIQRLVVIAGFSRAGKSFLIEKPPNGRVNHLFDALELSSGSEGEFLAPRMLPHDLSARTARLVVLHHDLCYKERANHFSAGAVPLNSAENANAYRVSVRHG